MCSSAYQFDVNGWFHTLAPGVYQRNALVHSEQTTLSVRVIAIVPTPEKAEALRRKKEHEARAKGRKLSEQARFLAGFILLVTTLPLPQWPTALVIELYACRWHIEVLFKRINRCWICIRYAVRRRRLLRLSLPPCWSLGCSWRRISKACAASSLMASRWPWP
jgi:hypothetical protein